MIDVYQATTQMTDESGQSYPITINALLDGALGPNGYYGVFTANMHTDDAASTGSDAIVASAKARGVPVVTARQMLDWLDGRNGSTFGSISWNSNTLSFSITAAAGSDGLRAMVPINAAPGASPVSRAGEARSPSARRRSRALITPSSRLRRGTTRPSTRSTRRLRSSRTWLPRHRGGSATITWNTNELSDSRVDYGTAPGALTLSASGGRERHDTQRNADRADAGDDLLLPGSVRGCRQQRGILADREDPPASFTMPTPSGALTDTTTADFAAGQADAGTYMGEAGDGEVLLAPTAGSEFSGSALPSGWSTTPWQAGGGATVGGGSIAVDGAAVGRRSTFAAGRTLEFAATFSGAAHQHVGFGVDFNSQPWAMFSTAGGGGLFARTNGTSTQIAGNWLGSPHRFRIEWTSTGATYLHRRPAGRVACRRRSRRRCVPSSATSTSEAGTCR